MRRIALLAGVMASAAAAPPIAARAKPVPAACDGVDALRFVCGVGSVEDLILAPDGRTLVGSAYKAGGPGLYLIDTRRKRARPAQLSVAPVGDPRFAGCPAPDLATLQTHGLDLVSRPDGHAIVYAVNHGGRESVEVFDLDVPAGRAAWIGCLILLAGTSGNAVAALGDGRIAITRFFDAGDPQGIAKVLRGEITGLVYLWHAGEGFTEVPDTRMSGANGLAASSDGRWLFVDEYGRNRIWRLPLAGGGAPAVVPVPFHPDNLHRLADGTLVTGQSISLSGPQGPHDWATMRLDPQTLRVTPVVHQRGLPQFDSATVAVQAGNALWFGSYHGDRIAYRPLPAGYSDLR